jgi:hypothetical protein
LKVLVLSWASKKTTRTKKGRTKNNKSEWRIKLLDKLVWFDCCSFISNQLIINY